MGPGPALIIWDGPGFLNRHMGRAQVIEKCLIPSRAQDRDVPSRARGQPNLASTYWNQGRWAEAEKLEVQVMETSKTALGLDHPSTLLSMRNLSYTLKGLGRHPEALSLLQTCVQLQEQRLGLAHPDTVTAMADLKAWQATWTRHQQNMRQILEQYRVRN
jgi:Tetratricopeptide repeat